MRMGRTRLITLLIIGSFIVLGIVLYWIIQQNVLTELRQSLSGRLPTVRTLQMHFSLHSQPGNGLHVFSYHADIVDVLVSDANLLLATGAGLVIVDGHNATAYHRGSGLPDAEALRIFKWKEEIYALLPAGLVRIKDISPARSGRLEAEILSPQSEIVSINQKVGNEAGNAAKRNSRLCDMAVIDDALVVVDDAGRVMQLVENEFQLIVKVKAEPNLHLGRLGRRVVVGGKNGRLQLIQGAGEAAEVKNIWPGDRPPENILCLLPQDDFLWGGTPTSLLRITANGVEQVLGGFAVTSMTLQRDRLLLGGLSGDILDRDGKTLFSVGAPIRRLTVAGDRLLIAAGNGLWASNKGGAPEETIRLAALAPIPDPYVNALFARGDGSVLIGGLNRGLALLESGKPTARSVALSDFGVNRIVLFGNDCLVATTNGLWQLDANFAVKNRWTEKQGLPNRYVSDLIVREQTIFAATASGLARITPTGMQAIDAFHGLAGNHLYCLARNDDVLAAGGLAGLSLLGGADGLTVTANFTAASGGLPHNWVNAVLAEENRWVVGTYGGGVVVIESSTDIKPAKATAGISVNPGAGARFGPYVVFGTLTRGLLISRNLQDWFFFADGLPSLNVTALAPSAEALWVGTDRGLALVPLSALAAIAP